MPTLNGPVDAGKSADSKAAVSIPVFGLDLGGCGAEQVERSLLSAPGVLEAYANRATETAYVRYDPDRIGLAALRGMIEAAGYRAGPPGTWRPGR